jgi:hypothetical protein
MTIPEEYTVQPIPAEQTYDWLKHKHYMYRVPATILHSFGLYRRDGMLLEGICTYGHPPRGFNNGYGLFGKDDTFVVQTFELNRLVVVEGLPRGTLSYFVSRTFRLLPKRCCLVSYADGNAGHHGYIYQATNWLYCGISESTEIFINKNTGKPIHRRTLSDILGHVYKDNLPDWVEVRHETSGKYRYVQLRGSPKEVAEMRKRLAYPVEAYPKGDNSRYASEYKPEVQLTLGF